VHVSASAELLITAQRVKQRFIPTQEFAMVLHARRAHSHRRCRKRPLPGRPHHRNLIAAAVDQARREHRAAHGDRCAELDTITAELARTQQATDHYLLAFERGTLDEDLAERLAALKTTRQQLTARRDELTAALDDVPTAPDPALLDQVADHLAEIISTGTPNQRKTLVGALVDRVIITGPDRLVPVFRIPQTAHVNGAATAQPAETAPKSAVRTMTKLVESRGIEPRSEPCKGPVLPLNYDPVVNMTVTVTPQVRPSFFSLSSR
jgi:hypothetical protein